MIQVTKESFFATVGAWDVHPRPEKRDGKGYVSVWETPQRIRVGESYQVSPHLCQCVYFVTDDVYQRHSQTLVRV